MSTNRQYIAYNVPSTEAIAFAEKLADELNLVDFHEKDDPAAEFEYHSADDAEQKTVIRYWSNGTLVYQGGPSRKMYNFAKKHPKLDVVYKCSVCHRPTGKNVNVQIHPACEAIGVSQPALIA